MFYIKLRKRGAKAYWFLSSNGSMNRLRVHAVEFPERERADKMIVDLVADNPGYEAKVVSK